MSEIQAGAMRQYRGSCHCGALEVVFESASAPEALTLRACDCGFCRRHGVRAVADPRGAVRIVETAPEALQRYRFGLATADFLLCRTCGCYLGALLGDDDGAWLTLNVNCLEARAAFDPSPPAVSYDHEDAEGRRARRRANWTPAELVIKG